MSDNAARVSQTGIFFACTEMDELVVEQLIPDHMMTHVYSGKITITTAEKSYSLSGGQTALFSKNQLAKFTKESVGDMPFKAVTILFKTAFLQQFYSPFPVPAKRADNPKVLFIDKHRVLDNLLESISLYSDLDEVFVSEELSSLKAREIITVIRNISKNVDLLLSDFSEPHKVDLADFMQRNFMFNISISRFAYLTGRSLAAFKRDFNKTFGISPQKWLTQTRLEQAHFLIADKKMKPSQVYVEVGFENFSHFTYAFRKFFGYTPSAALSPQRHNI